MAKKAKKKGADNDLSIVRLGGSEVTPKATKKARKQKEEKSREFRIEYTFISKDLEVILVRAANKFDAMMKFFNKRSTYRVRSIREISNAEEMQKKLDDARAKLKECQKRKKPASRKKAKTSKKS